MTDGRLPHIEFLVPAANETRWCDALAALIATDPAPIARFVGEVPDDVLREVPIPAVAGRGRDRLDLLLSRDGRHVAAIEAKLYADLSPGQLARYAAGFPDARRRFVLHLAGLPVHHGSAPSWESLTWESVLSAYSQSEHPWVRATAEAWLEKLPTLVPHVGPETVWNDVPDNAPEFELALRARTAWLARRMDTWCSIERTLEQSSGGGAWVVAMRAPITGSDHVVFAEVQEGTAAPEWRPTDVPYRERLKGPVVLVGLARFGIYSSEGFDWPLLRRAFAPYVASSALDDDLRWSTTSPNPRDPVDRQQWKAIVDDGAPTWLGKGYGMATARTHGVCAFGARIDLPPSSTLEYVDGVLQRLESLVLAMATTAAPAPPPSASWGTL
ncbi:PD-(D/E)XK nuclease family protein [Cellulomonas sp. DKR-3]|uniref:PD-(D/E)XK nuclease family protein n=1 Tax=Cellulomonas fulva TaxID=2835530 RepID=A0ABS5U283_9CELL|nr:PD-(D/E)XK nuclease family protein [Cellulomonas fulva]MBT0995472.1 PD-(D/E)XK nuclease family protein [Cellulomonas fulva]